MLQPTCQQTRNHIVNKPKMNLVEIVAKRLPVCPFGLGFIFGTDSCSAIIFVLRSWSSAILAGADVNLEPRSARESFLHTRVSSRLPNFWATYQRTHPVSYLSPGRKLSPHTVRHEDGDNDDNDDDDDDRGRDEVMAKIIEIQSRQVSPWSQPAAYLGNGANGFSRSLPSLECNHKESTSSTGDYE